MGAAALLVVSVSGSLYAADSTVIPPPVAAVDSTVVLPPAAPVVSTPESTPVTATVSSGTSTPDSASSQPLRIIAEADLSPWYGGLGAGIRIQDRADVLLKGYGNWDTQGFGFSVVGRYLLPIKAPVTIYPFVGLGWHRQDMDEKIDGTRVIRTFNMFSFCAGAGVEKRFGRGNHHGVSLELGYRHGKADYKYNTVTKIGVGVSAHETGTYRIPPFSAVLAYSFQFPLH